MEALESSKLVGIRVTHDFLGTRLDVLLRPLFGHQPDLA
jgi:hypothetical protein